MGWDYTDKVKDHFFNPKNVGRLEEPDGIGEVGSISCGDALTLTLKIDRDKDVIQDAKFQTFGCGSAIASSSILTEMIKGKKIDEALKITNADIADELGGLPAEKMHCSVMGREALDAAVANYRGEEVEEHEEDEGRIICYCFGVTEGKLRRVIAEDSLKTLEDVANYTKAGGGCGACKDEIEEILIEMANEQPAAAKPAMVKPTHKLTNLQRIELIQEILDQEIRPQLQKDQGDLELVDIEGTEVRIRMTGHCAGCMAAGLTSGWIEGKLQEIVDPEIKLHVEEA